MSSKSSVDRSPLASLEDPEEMKRIGELMLPFFKEIGLEAQATKVQYNKRRVVQLIGALKGGYFMRAVEKDPEIPYDLKMMAANATTSMAKFQSFVLRGVESQEFDDFVKLLYFAKDRIDRILGYLEVRAAPLRQTEMADNLETAYRKRLPPPYK